LTAPMDLVKTRRQVTIYMLDASHATHATLVAYNHALVG
jgi:hypothetical protein